MPQNTLGGRDANDQSTRHDFPRRHSHRPGRRSSRQRPDGFCQRGREALHRHMATRLGRVDGLMYYDSLGNMAAQLMPNRRRPKYAGAQPTPDEAKEAITRYLAYFGTYTVNGALARSRTIARATSTPARSATCRAGIRVRTGRPGHSHAGRRHEPNHLGTCQVRGVAASWDGKALIFLRGKTQ